MLFLFRVCLILLSRLTLSALALSEGDVRLVGSHLENIGRVEIYLKGQWGTICDRNYAGAADVICYNLNYTYSSRDFPGTSTKLMNKALRKENRPEIKDARNTTRILLGDIDCGALYSYPLTTVHILRCVFKFMEPNTATECTHDDDLAVFCDPRDDSAGTYDSEIRLIGGEYPSQGTLEMYLKKKWGNVCYNNAFQRKSAVTACRQLGYTHVEFVNKTRKKTSNTVWSGEILCTKSRPCLGFCFGKEKLNQTSCSSGYYVQLQCGFDLAKLTDTGTSSGNPIMCSWRKRYSKTPAYFVAIMSFSGFLWILSTSIVVIVAICYSVKHCPGYKLRLKAGHLDHTIN